MPNPYGMGNSYVPQYQQQSGGYLSNPFQTPSPMMSQGPAMGGPAPSPMMMSQNSPQQRDSTGVPIPQGQNFTDPFSSQGQFQQAQTGFQMNPNNAQMMAPWMYSTSTHGGAGLFGTDPSTSNRMMMGDTPLSVSNSPGSPLYALWQMAKQGQGAIGDSQALPGAGNSWQQFQGGMGDYMNNLNAWNGQYSQSAGNLSAQPLLQQLSGSSAAFGPAATDTNYATMYGNAQSQYNNVYNQYLNQGQFGLTGAQAAGGQNSYAGGGR